MFPLSSNSSKNSYFDGIFRPEPIDPFLLPEPRPNEKPIDLQEELDYLLKEVIEDAENITNIDSTESNSDWVKSLSWDLPNTAENFIKAIGGPDNWEKFKTLPAFIPMPEKLKTEVELYLKDEKVAE